MTAPMDKLTALVTVELWSDPERGYLVRALVRRGELARDVVGPHLAMTADDLRRELIEVCDRLVAML